MIALILISILILSVLTITLVFIHKKRSSQVIKKRLKDIEDASPYRKSYIPKPKNDFIFLKKENQQNANVEVISDGIGQDKEEIVGLAEPKGFWTKLIMSQKIGFLFARMHQSKNNDQGFWVTLINAQDMEKGKQKGKGR